MTLTTKLGTTTTIKKKVKMMLIKLKMTTTKGTMMG